MAASSGEEEELLLSLEPQEQQQRHLDDMSLDELMSLNITSDQELDCLFGFLRTPYNLLMDEYLLPGNRFCNSTWDGIICWPTTPAGATAVLPCFDELNGIKYDTDQNATRACQEDGLWATYSNYSLCSPLANFEFRPPNTDVGISEDTTTIYFSGYSLSIVALTLAIWIFTHFKDLRCLRNTIHTHLLVTYMMADLLWIATATLQLYRGETNKGSCIIVIFLHYFHLTNFFWMFVEGFYLYMLVVETFTADKIRLRIYAIIGWGVPLPVVVVWAIVKAYGFEYAPGTQLLSDDSQLMTIHHHHQQQQQQHGGHHNHNNKLGINSLESFLSNCPWMAANNYDWIYMAPAIVVLFVNILFLIKIMWVLITKLRSANSVETQQYRKGSKALLVLIPLLGITYVLVIAGPSEGTVAIYFSHIRAVLLSTQGFLVTLFFCFLNTEVRNTLRHHWVRWRTSRGLGQSNNQRGRGQGNSPRNRGTRTSMTTGIFSGVTTACGSRKTSHVISESTRRLQSSFQQGEDRLSIPCSTTTAAAAVAAAAARQQRSAAGADCEISPGELTTVVTCGGGNNVAIQLNSFNPPSSSSLLSNGGGGGQQSATAAANCLSTRLTSSINGSGGASSSSVVTTTTDANSITTKLLLVVQENQV